MTIDIHKIISNNKILRNLLKPWGSSYDRNDNSKSKSLRKKLFNAYTGPTNLVQEQIDFNPKTGELYKIYDQLSSSNDRCSMYHDIQYSVAENIGKNEEDIKRLKHIADDKWLKCFKLRTPYDALAYSAIKSKKVLGLGKNFTMEDLSNELNKPVINKFPRKKIIVNHIDEIHSCDLVDMQKYYRINKGYKYVLQILMYFQNIHSHFLLNLKKYRILNNVSKKYLKKENINLYGLIKNLLSFLKKC